MQPRNEVARVSWPQLHAFRLTRHHLAGRAPRESLVAVVRDMCGAQAQLMPAARTALWARIEGLAPGDVEQALCGDRALVKTWAMRGTAHLLPARDIPMYVRALGRGLVEETRRWISRHGVTEQEIQAMTAAVLDALNGDPLTRRELSERVIAVVGPGAKRWVEHSWGGVVKQACLEGGVCFGPDRGQEITFVRLDRWLPGLIEAPADDVVAAGARLLRQYLRSYGPATLQDFCAWSGLKARDSVPVWSQLKGELAEVSVEGKTSWILGEDLRELSGTTLGDGHVRLLPSFDSYMLGHHDKSHLVDDAHYKAVYRKAGWLSPVVLAGGRAVGVWSGGHRGKRVLVKVQLFSEVPGTIRDGIESEAVSLGRFLGAACDVAFVVL